MSTLNKKNIWLKIKEFLTKYETKIVLFIGFCLISAISYEFGILQGQKWQQKPLIIEKAYETPQSLPNATSNGSEAVMAKASVISPALEEKTTSSKCAFVGSKNSDKFYLPTCSYAKRVKPENLACYTSEADALAKGKIKSECK